jgi:putative endonuclease
VSSRQALGAAGEDLAAVWYEARGYTVATRNWRCREGELDLVLVHPELGIQTPRSRGLVVFCEVKTRRGNAFGAPFEAVTVAKQRTIRSVALRWLAEHPQRGADLRFDVASVLAPRTGAAVVEVIEAAF